jgi:hypothetical protein
VSQKRTYSSQRTDGYHSWLVAKTYEEILMAGGGPDDETQEQMTSYRSEFGGIAAGLSVLGTLSLDQD